MRAEYHEMMTAGVEFSTDNAFARFANGVVEDLRMGAERWSGSWKIRRRWTGRAAFGPVSKKREVPDGAFHGRLYAAAGASAAGGGAGHFGVRFPG